MDVQVFVLNRDRVIHSNIHSCTQLKNKKQKKSKVVDKGQMNLK